MRKISKKIGNIMIAILGTLFLTNMALTSVFGNNCSDSEYVFVFTGDDWQTTKERVKEDDSFVYMKCTYSSNAEAFYNAYVWGYNSDENVDFLASNRYRIGPNMAVKMVNDVYENGGNYAFVRAKSSYLATFYGVWSPDSI